MGRALTRAGLVDPDPPRICLENIPEPVVPKELPAVPFEAPASGRVVDEKNPPPPPAEDDRDDPEDDVPRVRGRMVWLHKTAPVLEIEGRPGLTPEEMAAGRRR